MDIFALYIMKESLFYTNEPQLCCWQMTGTWKLWGCESWLGRGIQCGNFEGLIYINFNKFKPWLIDWASGRLIALSLKNLHNDNNHLSFQIGRGIIANTTDIENRLSTMALSKIFAPPMKKNNEWTIYGSTMCIQRH